MRLVSDQNNKKHPTDNQNDFRWKVLLVDDDPDIIAVTKLSLRSFQYEGYKLDIMAANNASQARYLVEQNPDLAVMIIDVVIYVIRVVSSRGYLIRSPPAISCT